MNQWKLAVMTIFSLALLLFLHMKGMYGHWYLNFFFFDLITHFLGGVGIALSVLYVLKNPKYIIPLTFFAGVIWELFEVYYDLTGYPIVSLSYKLDTVKDIAMDILGAFTVWLVFKNKKQ